MAFIASASYRDPQPGDQLTDKVMSEIARRIAVNVTETGDSTQIIFSPTPPSDITKYWQQTNAAGQPIGALKWFDQELNNWTDGIDQLIIPESKDDADNMIVVEPGEIWSVSQSAIEGLINGIFRGISTNDGNQIVLDQDGRLFVAPAQVKRQETSDNVLQINSLGELFVPSQAGMWVLESPVEVYEDGADDDAPGPGASDGTTPDVAETEVTLASLGLGGLFPTTSTHAMIRAKGVVSYNFRVGEGRPPAVLTIDVGEPLVRAVNYRYNDQTQTHWVGGNETDSSPNITTEENLVMAELSGIPGGQPSLKYAIASQGIAVQNNVSWLVKIEILGFVKAEVIENA